MIKRIYTWCIVACLTVAAAAEAATITAGEHLLAPNTPEQTVEIVVAGGDAVSGVNLFAQIGDGGPELADYGLPAGTDGPEITAVDLKSGTIFDGISDPQFGMLSIPQVVSYSIAYTALGGTVAAEGRLATLMLDTTGFSSGSWELRLGDVLPGLGPYHTNFAPTPAAIVNGTITLTVPGDANLDGWVSDLDASILASHWQMPSGATWGLGDFNGDGMVTDLDASILVSHWQYEISDGTPLPEPAPIVALLTAALAAILIRFRLWRRHPASKGCRA